MTELRDSLRAFGLVALLLVSLVAPMLSLGVSTAVAAGPPSGMVGVPDSNVADIRADGIERNVTESDLEGAVFVSDHADTTEVSLVTTPQATEVAQGGSPSDVAFEAVCNSPAAGRNPRFDCDQSMALVISDDIHHDGRRVAVRTSVVREALGWVPESLTIANNETGEQWRTSASVQNGWLVASVDHFSSNAVTWTGTVELDGSPATDSAQYEYELQDLSATSDPQGRLVGAAATEWDNVSAAGLSDGDTLSVHPSGHKIRGPVSGNPEVVLTGEGRTQSHTESGVVTGGDSATLSIDGNVEPSGPSGEPELQITGQRRHYSHSSSATGQDVEWVYSDIPENQLTQVEFEVEDDWTSGNRDFDLYIAKGDTANGNATDGTHVCSGNSGYGSWKTVQCDVSLDLSSTDQITFELDWGYAADNVKVRNPSFQSGSPQNVEVTASDGTTATLGNFGAGETKTRSMDLSAGVSSLDFAGTGGSLGWSLDYTERTKTESPEIDFDGDGTPEISHTGLLNDGETAAYQASSLSIGDDTATVSTAGGSTVGVEVRLQEVSETRAVEIEQNGEVIASHAGTLDDGETVNFSASSDILRNGTNTINVSVGDGSLSTDAPTPAVGFTYSHSAQFDQTTDYSGEQFTERYNVSRTWGGATENATLTIPFDGHIVAMRSLTVYQNGTEVPPSWSRFRENSTTLEVGFGNVAPGTTTRVTANGSKVKTSGLTLQVLEPSAPGERLESRIELSNVDSDAYIDVGPTVEGRRIHHLQEESWTANEYTVVDTSGAQKLYVPNASDGSTATVTYLDTKAHATKGDVRIGVEETGSSPQFQVRPGPGGSGDAVEFTYYQTTTGTTYYLKTLEGGEWTLVDSAVAESPVTLTTDDSDQVLSIFEGSGPTNTGNDDSGDRRGAGSGGLPLGSSLFVVISVALLAGVWFVSQEYGSGRISTKTFLYLSASVIVVFGLEILSASLVSGIVSVLGDFLSGASEAWPLIILVGGGLAYYWLNIRDKEASTPDEEYNFEIPARRNE